jgi:ribosomal protein S18 acetylase RimI-like enzyme
MTHQAILQNIVPATCYATLSSNNQIVACGLGILEGDSVGLYDIITEANQRRKGFGHALILNILQWAKQCGAKQAYLSVEKENDPALNLYAKLGFTEIYEYWYRVMA